MTFNPSTLHADKNRRRKAARWSCKPCRWACTEQTKGSGPRAPCFARSAFHAARSANVEPSHQSGTRRECPPLVVPRRRRKCGRVTSTTTSSNCRFAISETRRPQQHARRTITRLRCTFAEQAARGARSVEGPRQHGVKPEPAGLMLTRRSIASWRFSFLAQSAHQHQIFQAPPRGNRDRPPGLGHRPERSKGILRLGSRRFS
jgi:hypothetical protein